VFKKTVLTMFLTAIFGLILLLPKAVYALDPLETLKNIKDTAVGLGESLLQKAKKLPKTIAVLPATGEGEEQDRIEIRTSFSNHISYKNYEQIKITDVDTKLYLAKKETGKDWNSLTPQELGKVLNVDGLVYVHIIGIEKFYAALYGSLTLKLKVKLVSAETGDVLWEKEDSVTERSGGVPTSPWSAISTAVSSALVLRESVKVALIDKLCRNLAKEMPEPKVAKAKRPPSIYSVLTNALDSPFKAQDEILVSLQGEEGLTAYFDIGDEKKAIQLAEIKPGEYVGKYIVRDGDNWTNKTITAYLYNPKDKLEAKYIVSHAITTDTVPPSPVTDIKVSMQKDAIHLTWTPPLDDDIKDYVILRATVDNPDFVEIASVSVPEYKDSDISFGKKYYYRISARDKAKNLSKYAEISSVAVKQGPTFITGEIKENTIFYAAGSPYILKGNVEILKGASLTIEEGTVVEFERDAKLIILGQLIINGKKDANVTFKGAEYDIILKDTSKDAFLANYTYFLGGRTFVVTNAFASFSNTTFEDYNLALNIERNATVNINDSIFRKNKLAIKITDSKISLKNVEISGSRKAIEIAGNTTFGSEDLRLKNNSVHLTSDVEIEIKDIETSDNQEIDVIRKVKGDIEIKTLKPFGKSFKTLKKEFIEDVKKELALSLVKDNYSEATKKVELLKELSEKDYYELSDIIVYLLYKIGDTQGAKELLSKGFTKSPKELEHIIDKGEKSEIVVKFVDIKVALGSSLDGVDRAGVTKAKWRAVKNFVEEKVINLDRDNLAVLNDKIIPKSSDYTINVIPIFTQAGDVSYNAYYMIFLDNKKILSDLKELRLLGEVNMETKFAIVDCTGLGVTKGMLLKTLQKLKFTYSEYGMGSCEPSSYYDKAKVAGLDVILTISESAKVAPSLLGGNLKNINANIEIKAYDAFLAKPLFNLTKGTNIYHMNDELGKEIALKNAYEALTERFEREVLSIEKVFAIDEGRKKVKKAFYAEKYLPPVEVKVDKVEAIFANNYKVYSEKPFIEITVSNNTSGKLEAIKISVMVKDYMDFPTEHKLELLEALSTKTVKLTGVFNNKLLELTENTTLQSDISVKFFKDGVEKSLNVTQPVEVYEKHALIWDDRNKIAIYVTPKDPAIVDFTREISRSVKRKLISTNFSLGMAVFEAMRSIGIVYQQDPKNPYQVVSEKVGTVDYVQYARETLKRRAGDCDDLVSLFISLVESLGIDAVAVDYPGHIFAMFDTGVPKEDIEKVGLSKELIVIYEDKVYIPIELTLLEESFYNAWMKGVANYKENLGKGLKFVSMQKAWQIYKPATLPPETVNISLPTNFENFYKSAYEKVIKERNAAILKGIRSNLIKPEQVLYITQKTATIEDAFLLGSYLIDNGVEGFAFLNDLGNIAYLTKNYETAVDYYKKALAIQPDNPFLINNLLYVLEKMGKKNEVKIFRDKIQKLAPFLKEE
jgi:tetratricopeptide (TPR) repeat protein